MKASQEASSIKYAVRIRDPSTNRTCEAYLSTDWDLESLLLFLRTGGRLECDVRDTETDELDP
jgi:hypothetical protein